MRLREQLNAALLVGAMSAVASVTAPGLAHAQGFFDFLFGGPQHPAPPPPSYNYPPPPPPGIGRVAPPPMEQERVNGGDASTGHGVAFCVRLCDGQHFPMEKMANATPAETCQAICPHASTKVFFGSEIAGAVAQDGQHYSNMQTAFVYRKQVVANCTCNGKEPFGLSSFDVKNDPTLRPGDIVSTNSGLLSYTGRSGQAAAFTPVNRASLPVDIGSAPEGSVPVPQSQEQPAAIVQQSPATPQSVQQSAPPPTSAPPGKPQAPIAPLPPRSQSRPAQ